MWRSDTNKRMWSIKTAFFLLHGHKKNHHQYHSALFLWMAVEFRKICSIMLPKATRNVPLICTARFMSLCIHSEHLLWDVWTLDGSFSGTLNKEMKCLVAEWIPWATINLIHTVTLGRGSTPASPGQSAASDECICEFVALDWTAARSATQHQISWE